MKEQHDLTLSQSGKAILGNIAAELLKRRGELL
jgi:hypothetical protein